MSIFLFQPMFEWLLSCKLLHILDIYALLLNTSPVASVQALPLTTQHKIQAYTFNPH